MSEIYIYDDHATLGFRDGIHLYQIGTYVCTYIYYTSIKGITTKKWMADGCN